MNWDKAIGSFVLLCCLAGNVMAQCMMQELPFSTIRANSGVIVEGKVIEQTPFWHRGKIHTAHTVQLYTLYKGAVGTGETITIVTYGGQIGNVLDVAYPNVQLQKGRTGLFFANASGIQYQQDLTFELYAATQGVIEYDLANKSARGAFHDYPNISTDLHSQLPAPVMQYEPLPFPTQTTKPNNAKQAITITGLDPLDITAGTRSVLTITGSGFGGVRGNGFVAFTDANTFGSSMVPITAAASYISWSNTEIQVLVPASFAGVAGSGPVKVKNNNADSTNSSDQLSIPFAYQEVLSQNNKYYNPVLYSQNANGQMNFLLNNDFAANTSARAAFERALETIRCQTGVNFIISNTTPIDTAGDDNANVILFEQGNDLPDGVLGITFLRFTACLFLGEWYWRPFQMDIVFDNATNWSFASGDPSPNEYDFQSVALHELGHANLLGHVVFTGAAMVPSISPGKAQKILAINSDVLGGRAVLDSSQVPQPCGGILPMKRADTSGCIVGIKEIDVVTLPTLSAYPNPSSGSLIIPTVHIFEQGTTLSLKVYNLSGEQKTTFFYTANPDQTLQVDLRTLAAGVYFLQVSDGIKSHTWKVGLVE